VVDGRTLLAARSHATQRDGARAANTVAVPDLYVRRERWLLVGVTTICPIGSNALKARQLEVLDHLLGNALLQDGDQTVRTMSEAERLLQTILDAGDTVGRDPAGRIGVPTDVAGLVLESRPGSGAHRGALLDVDARDGPRRAERGSGALLVVFPSVRYLTHKGSYPAIECRRHRPQP
jgi:hypothetical protein